MSREELLHRITADADVLGGRARIRGTRIPVTLVLDSLAEGLSEREIVEHFPALAVEDVKASIVYASGP